MTTFAAGGLLMTLIMFVIGVFILYLVVKAAVRNGIDESEAGKKIRNQKHGNGNDPYYDNHEL